MDWNSGRLTAILENALLEDRATRDATSYACIDPNQRASATIVAKQDCILAGIGCVARILDVYAALDGAVTAALRSHDPSRDLRRRTLAQRTVRCGCQAQRARRSLVRAGDSEFPATHERHRHPDPQICGGRCGHAHSRLLDTRKTAPGLRVIDKYAVRCGGGQNHRLDLSDGVLIKNNHIALAEGIAPALERAHRNRRGSQPIEVEVRSLDELELAAANGAEAILLDNMSPEDVRRAVERCSQADLQKDGRRIPLECSGGIRLENVRAYAETGVDFISIGYLTHSPQAADMSMRVVTA